MSSVELSDLSVEAPVLLGIVGEAGVEADPHWPGGLYLINKENYELCVKFYPTLILCSPKTIRISFVSSSLKFYQNFNFDVPPN